MPFRRNITEFTVRVGSSDALAGGLLYKVTQIIIHEKYGNFLNDMALVRLDRALIFSEGIQPIELERQDVPANSKLTVSGWGRLHDFGDVPRTMQWIRLTRISQEQCKQEIGYGEDAILCLKHPAGEGSCFGDSGGPAVYKGKLAGVLSFVSNNCGTALPDGFAKVSHFYHWIRKYANL